MNSVAFSSCAGILRHLEGRGFFHMDLSLDRMEAALRALGLTRPPFLVAQVLGTNGKGSTSAFLSSLARAHGHRVGLYTSPHFLLPEERIRIDGRPLPCASWVDAANEVVRVGPDLTYFEFLTVLAVALFARAGVSLAVMEAGLGGRYDATTALAADVLAYAPIAKDHAAVLGPTLRRIAADKAAAIRSAAPVFSAPQFPDAGEELRTAAQRRHAPLTFVPPLEGDAPLGLAGAHQRVNAGLALAVWKELAPRLGSPSGDAAAQARGLASAFVPGRLQWAEGARMPGDGLPLPPLLLDGAHNAHGVRSLVGHLRERGLRPRAVIYSCLGDKEWRPAVALLRRQVKDAPFLVPGLHNGRAASAGEVARFLNGCAPGTASVVDGVPDALRRAAAVPPSHAAGPARDPVLICGSLYLLSEVYACLPCLLDGGTAGEAFPATGNVMRRDAANPGQEVSL